MNLYTASIQKLYVAYFSRPADVAGLAYWEGVVGAANGDTSAVSAAFANSAEYQAAYAGKNPAQVVDTVYMNLFGRNAEAEGVSYWSALMGSGALTVDVVVTAVASGAQGADRVAYDSKVTAATAFTSALDTSAEILGYSGALAISRAIAFIAGITTAGELAAATARTTLDATVSAVTGTAAPVPEAPPTVPSPKPVPVPVVPTPAPPEGAQTINLGPGDNRLGDITVRPGDIIDGGAGFDTLPLTQVTPLNMLAFYNFERIEANTPRKLDMAGFEGRNKITEILLTGGEPEAEMELFNVGADASVRIAADQVGIVLDLAVQRAFTLTVDIDELAAPVSSRASYAVVNDASTINIVFDNDFKIDRAGATGADESLLNGSTLFLSGGAAGALNVVSDGDHAYNALVYSLASPEQAFESVTVSGTRPLALTLEGGSLIDAAASSGGIAVSTRYLAQGAVLKLGSGTDTIAVANKSTPANPVSIFALEKTAGVALSAAPGDAVAAAAAMAAADTLRINGAIVADASGGDYSGGTISRGILTFTGKGPASLGEAFAIAAQAAEGEGEAVLFAFLDSSYLFVRELNEMGVKLVGLTGVTALVAGATDHLFVV